VRGVGPQTGERVGNKLTVGRATKGGVRVTKKERERRTEEEVKILAGRQGKKTPVPVGKKWIVRISPGNVFGRNGGGAVSRASHGCS